MLAGDVVLGYVKWNLGTLYQSNTCVGHLHNNNAAKAALDQNRLRPNYVVTDPDFAISSYSVYDESKSITCFIKEAQPRAHMEINWLHSCARTRTSRYVSLI